MKNTLYHQWRKKRHRYQRRMAAGNLAWMALLTILVLLELWWDTHCTGYFFSPEYIKSCFMETSERVATWVDDYRSEKGHLPDTLNIGWLYLNRDDYPWVCYEDTTGWDWMPIEYLHWGDSAYSISYLRWWGYRFVSAPGFEGFLFFRWDEEKDTVSRVDTIYRRH